MIPNRFIRFHTVTREIPKISAARDWFPSVLSRASISCFFFISVRLRIGSVEARERKKKSVEMMARFTREIKPMCQGIHFMPLGWSDAVVDVIDAINDADMKFAHAVNA